MRRGLTIIETVVAITMLTVALIAILSLCPATNAAARQAEVRLQAQNLAQSILEQQRLYLPDPQPPTALAAIYAPDYPAMQPTLEVVKCGAGDRCREIRVTLSWENFGKSSSLSVATVVTPLKR